jgi:hypothetical protein
MTLRRSVKAMAIALAAAPLILPAGLLLWAGSTSVVMVVPGAHWVLAAVFVTPMLLGLPIWRLADLVR